MNARIQERTAHVVTLDADEPGPAYVQSVTTLNRHLGTLPAFGGNSVELLPDYAESIAAMIGEINEAKTFVHVQFYITAWDDLTGPLFEALVRRDARGGVRLLFDHLGSRGIPGYKGMLTAGRDRDRLASDAPDPSLKGEFGRPDLRNHRKILVVDGRVAFAGSQNLVEPGYNKPKNHAAGREWVELMARVEGPVVAALDAVFASDWYSESDQSLADEWWFRSRCRGEVSSPVR